MEGTTDLSTITASLQWQLDKNWPNPPFPKVQNVVLTEIDIKILREKFKSQCVIYNSQENSVSLFPNICGGDGGSNDYL